MPVPVIEAEATMHWPMRTFPLEKTTTDAPA